MVAYDGGLADDHTRAVVDGEVLANLCPRVDVDAGARMGLFGDDTRYHWHLHPMQHVGQPVVRHRVHHGVAVYHLAVVRGSGVAVEHRLHVGIEQALHLGQLLDEPDGHLFGSLCHIAFGTVLTELQSARYLSAEQREELLHRHADVVGTSLLVALTLVEIVGEDDVLRQADDASDLFH